MTFDPHEYRRHFPLTTTWAFLNHASYGPLPTPTSEAVQRLVGAWQSPPDLNFEEYGGTVESVKAMIARLVNGSADNVAFTGSLAESMSLAGQGIDWKDGDNCIIPEGEFPSVVYPFLNLEHRGVEVRFASKDRNGRTSLDCIRELMDDRTRAVAMSHVEFQDGFRNDLSALAELCHANDALAIVDVTQSLGPCEIDVQSSGVDVIAAHSYKWLMASFGIGVMHLSDRAIERIRPTYAGRLTVDQDFQDLTYELNYREGAARYQTGGLNWIAMTGLKTSLEMIQEIGSDSIARHTVELTDRLLDSLERRGYRIVSSREPDHRSAIVSFSAGNDERNQEIVQLLEQQKVSVALRGPGIRVSPYFYNTDEDVDRLLEALPAIS